MWWEPSHEQRRHESDATDAGQDLPQYPKTLGKGGLNLEPSLQWERGELWDEHVHDGSPLWDGLNKRRRKLPLELVLDDGAPDHNNDR